MTQAISRQLINASDSDASSLRTKAEIQKTDRKIPPLEIIRGRKSNYSTSELGKLEMVLDEMETEEIDPDC